MTGRKMANMVIRMDAPVSTVDTTGFTRPPVAAVEASLVTALELFIKPASPPPAMSAILHFANGPISTKVLKLIKVPAAAASGIAIVSRALSTNGI